MLLYLYFCIVLMVVGGVDIVDFIVIYVIVEEL